jgi:hypothetical protein
MTAGEMMSILLSYERRLASVADQAHETREQARHTLDRVNRLRREPPWRLPCGAAAGRAG